jgi:uncharacterized protein with HEPN domain
MTDDVQRLSDYLTHVIQAIERIDLYVGAHDKTRFLTDPLVQDAVIRNLEVIGEACNNIEKRYAMFAATHPELPLSSAYQMRNAIAHGYFKVDLETVWWTIKLELPALLLQIRQAKSELMVGGNGPQ